MNATLQLFARRLADLSGQNRLLSLSRLRLGYHLDLTDFDWLLKQPASSVRDAIIKGQKKVNLAAIHDPRNPQNNVISRQLAKLEKQLKLIQEEQGTYDLFLGYPFVNGPLPDAFVVNAPLLLWPLNLSKSETNWYLTNEQEAPILNHTLLLAWSHYTGKPLPQQINQDWAIYIDSINLTDVQSLMTGLYRFLELNGIEIRLGPELMHDNLLRFQKPETPELVAVNQSNLQLMPQAVLGIFHQPDGFLQQDYAALIQKQETLEALFTPFEEPIEVPVQTSNYYLPLPYDASQWQVIKKVRAGYNLVVQGPPGSGKSQLIANLIADYISRGKTVALVCQKRVALDVVAKRLSELGLSDWLALIHDHQEDKRQYYNQLSRQIESISQYLSIIGTIGSLELENKYNTNGKYIDGLISQLGEVKSVLYADNGSGLTAKQLYQARLKSDTALKWPEAVIKPNVREWQRLRLEVAKAIGLKIIADQNWPQDLNQLLNDYGLTRSNWAKLPEPQQIEADFGLLNEMNLEQLKNLQYELQTIEGLLQVYGHKDATSIEADLQTLNALLEKRAILTSYKAWNNDEILLPAILSSEHARATFWGRLFWRFTTNYKVLKPYLDLEKGVSDALADLQNQCQAIRQFNHTFNQLRSKYQSPTLDLVDLIEQLQSDWQGLTQLADTRLKLGQLANVQIAKVVNAIKAYSEIGKYFNPGLHHLALQQLLELNYRLANIDHNCWLDIQKLDAYLTQLPNWFTAWLQAVNHPSTFDAELINTWLDGAEVGLCAAWIPDVEAELSELASLGTEELVQAEQLLQHYLTNKYLLTTNLVKMRLMERTALGLEHNRLGNRTTYRDLTEQINKKQRLWPIRKLWSHYFNDIARLTPCLLTSPESMVAMLPQGERFDLVIFDESSQCYAEHGIPVLARAKQTVVLGDSQQLQPFNLYQVRYEDEEQEEDSMPDLNALSFLDLAARYLPTQHLLGHYRSEDLSLIAFSNQHFYNGQLFYLPKFQPEQEGVKAITYHYIPEGEWVKQTNRIEAEAVVNFVLQQYSNADHHTDSIGVITFNAPQQELIESLLKEALDAVNKLWPAALFVKSIEHVQGDEADIIVCSLAYGKDRAGRVRAQFGSLNQAGGANRLNVAITRARKALHVFASIKPDALPTDDAKFDGPKLLKQWLTYCWLVCNGEHDESVQYYQPWAAGSLIEQLASSYGATSVLPFADGKTQETIILTDDERFAKVEDAKTEFGLIPLAIRKAGWKIERKWARLL